MELNFFEPYWQHPNRIGSVITTRLGGYSDTPFQSFNLGLHVGDDPFLVEKNRCLLQEKIGVDRVVYLNQVHGTDVVDACDLLNCDPVSADALICRKPNVALAIMTADCLPVLLADGDGTVVGNAHAGWRGLCNGVLENTVRAMKTAPQNLYAYLGPCIGANSFEVGVEVKDAFALQDPESICCFSSKGDRYLASLSNLARQRLAKVGLDPKHIFGGTWDTYAQGDLFFSYRLEKHTGRMASLVWLKD